MEKRIFKSSTVAFAGVASAFVFVTGLTALSCPATAMAAEAMAHSVDTNGKVTTYYTTDEALAKGYEGNTIVMDCDWNFTGPMTIAEGKSITIDMNGHVISSSEEAGISTNFVIDMEKKSSLTLESKNTKSFTYNAYNSAFGKAESSSITTGGLITGNSTCCGINMDPSCNLTLENVSIAGNGKGGILSDYECLIIMRSGSSIEHNRTGENAGGVKLTENSTLKMDNATIAYNYAGEQGGGIYAGRNTVVDLENGSKIANNTAGAGGGIYVKGTNTTIRSWDKTGVISGNYAEENKDVFGGNAVIMGRDRRSGGAIHIGEDKENSGEVTIAGLTISNNRAARDAGGIEIEEEDTTVSNCTITGNTANYDGAAIYADADWCVVKGCTITGNTAVKDGGGIYVNAYSTAIKNSTITGNVCDSRYKNFEGGGVFVGYEYNLNLSGVCIIKDNMRGAKGTSDDVFLSAALGNTGLAYIVGGVSEGTKVGVRTTSTGNRKIAKNLSSNCYGAFFMDLSDYYVSYEHDTYGNMWQDKGALAFAANLNGKGTGRYNQGTAITVDGSSKDAARAFWYWDASKTTGLYPVSDYINETTMYNPLLTFAMPQNDVNARAVYADKVTKASIELEAPEAGKALPATATLKRADGGDGAAEATAAVTWYKVKADGSKVAVSGNAKPGTEYAASITVAQDQKAGLFFNGDIKAENVTVGTAAAASASVDGSTGLLAVETGSFKTTGESAADENDGKVTVNLENAGLQAIVGGGKATQGADGGTLSPVEVYYSEGSDSVTITAPKVEGLNFCNWDGVKDGWVNDDAEGVITIPAEDLVDGLEVTAVYTPVIAKLELGLSAPKAGEKLSTKATSLTAVGSDGETLDLMDALGKKSLSVEWAPGDKKASYSTAYAAIVELDANAGDVEGAEGVLAEDAEVTLSDGTQSACASFAVFEGKICLLLLAPDTDSVKAVTGLKAAKAGKGAVKVSWKKASRSGVQVRCSTAKTMKGAKKALAKGKAVKAKTIKKLKSGKKYYFQVRSYKTVNGQKCYSSWSKKASVKVK